MGLFGFFGGGRAADPVSANIYELAAADEIARANRIAARWRAYHGQHPKPLKVRVGQPDDNVIVNFARIVVDAGVSYLFGSDIRFEIDELAETEAEQWLEECWRANRQMTLLHRLGLSGAIAGHAFAKIVPAQPYPRIVVLDPATVSVTWEPDDIEQVVGYRIQYPAIDPASGKPIVVRQLIERDGAAWRITDQRGSAQGAWQTIAETAWPYAWPPVADAQNLPCPNEYWGISDLEDDILALNAGINFVLSNLARIIRYHAHPKTWGKGFGSAQLSVAVDETIILPSKEAELHNLEMTSDLASSIELYERLREALHEITRIPEVATGKLQGVGSLSGAAIQILYSPLTQKTETKRRTYGDLIVELNRRLLALGGFGESLRTTIHWPELVPGDPEGEARTLLTWQQLGVSQDTILQRLGLDPDVERAKREATGAQLGDQLLTAFERGQ